MKKLLLLGITIAGVTLVYRAARPHSPVVMHSVLPTEAAAKALLNSTHRHREWVSVENVRAFIVYPERSDKAPVVVLSAGKQGASDWLRAVADQAAAEGFIAVVPDVLSGLGPHGGDSNDFANPAAIAAALDRMGRDEIVRRTNAVRDYAIGLPAANGKSASIEFSAAGVQAAAAGRSASFKVADAGWPQAVAFLVKQTGDKPVLGENLNVPEDHSMHIGMMMGQTVRDKKGGGLRGYPI